MDLIYEPLKKAQLIFTQKSDPTTIHPYAFQSASFNAQKNKVFWALGNFTVLGSMARCIAKLLEQSVSAFYESLKEFKSSAKGKAVTVVNHPNFASILRDTEDIVNGREFEGHPKMMKLRELIVEHFDKSAQEGTLDQTRIMVFCSFREVVDEIVERLNQKEGIRATRLVGQGVDTKGKKGLAQKQQNEVLSHFKKGVYNVLVATSIGEEGLDIGELDLIICYEASKSPIRTVSDMKAFVMLIADLAFRHIAAKSRQNRSCQRRSNHRPYD
jgi:ATP-dependent DNA helicase MPH1